MKKLSCLDLFSGAGGLSEGFLETDKFEFVAHVEWESPMVNTLRNNLEKRWGYTKEDAKASVIQFDIQKTDELINGNWSEETKKEYSKCNANIVVEKGIEGLLNNKKIDVIIGGPPCQAYSVAGRAQDANSMKNDYRNYLFESFVKVVNHFKPKMFVFENVPGILSAKPGDEFIIDRIYKAFEEIGYSIRNKEEMKKSIYTASDFEVPQERRRVIIFGVRQGENFSVEDCYKCLDKQKSNTSKKTVRDALYGMPRFVPLESCIKQGRGRVSHKLIDDNHYSLHEARFHNMRDINVFKDWIANNMNDATPDKQLEYYKNVTGKDSNHIKYRSLSWDKPSPTVVAHLHKDGLMFIHPDINQARSITVREAALLQSFPKDYEFIGSQAYCFKMIGNAVPVLFAKSIAEAVFDSINNKKKILNVLVACEESQRVCTEFRKLGHNAYSCDLLACSGGHPEWHFQQDVLQIIKNRGGILQNGETAFIEGKWDLMVAHPPCTYLAVSGAKWYYHPEDKSLPISERRPHPSFPNRARDREEGANFFLALANADIEHIAIENPIGIMNTRFRKPDQVVQPYHFGDEASKATCLWLKNLKPLMPTKIVGKGEFISFGSGKKLAKWYSDALTKTKSAEERRTMRSKTFPGFAKAIAEQWSKELTE